MTSTGTRHVISMETFVVMVTHRSKKDWYFQSAGLEAPFYQKIKQISLNKNNSEC